MLAPAHSGLLGVVFPSDVQQVAGRVRHMCTCTPWLPGAPSTRFHLTSGVNEIRANGPAVKKAWRDPLGEALTVQMGAGYHAYCNLLEAMWRGSIAATRYH